MHDKQPERDVPRSRRVGAVLTVPQAARRICRDPSTVRRWIRSGRLPAQRIDGKQLIDERDLARAARSNMLPLPAGWDRTIDGEPMPDIVAALDRVRAGR
jgi:excisionase family DNA binding protein